MLAPCDLFSFDLMNSCGDYSAVSENLPKNIQLAQMQNEAIATANVSAANSSSQTTTIPASEGEEKTERKEDEGEQKSGGVKRALCTYCERPQPRTALWFCQQCQSEGCADCILERHSAHSHPVIRLAKHVRNTPPFSPLCPTEWLAFRQRHCWTSRRLW